MAEVQAFAGAVAMGGPGASNGLGPMNAFGKVSFLFPFPFRLRFLVAVFLCVLSFSVCATSLGVFCDPLPGHSPLTLLGSHRRRHGFPEARPGGVQRRVVCGLGPL